MQIGIGWRPETAGLAARRPVDVVEVIAEGVRPDDLGVLAHWRGRAFVHGVRLSLGSELDPARVAHLAAVADALDAPVVSEHVAFTRGGGRDAGHLLPMPRTRDALDVLVRNVRACQAEVPLALEHPAALFCWPDDELTLGQFLTELLERTDARLLLDLANLHTDHVNHGVDPLDVLDALPLERLAYVHVAGGTLDDGGLAHDTHAHALWPEVPALLAELRARCDVPAVVLERDDGFAAALADVEAELGAELDALATSVREGSAGRAQPTGATPARSAPLVAPGSATRPPLAERQAALIDALYAAAPLAGVRATPSLFGSSTGAAPEGSPRGAGQATPSGPAARTGPGRELSSDVATAAAAPGRGGSERASRSASPATEPIGFDPVRLAAAGAALRRKRERELRRAFPRLAALAPPGAFAAWISGPVRRDDAERFAATLGPLPSDVRRELQRSQRDRAAVGVGAPPPVHRRVTSAAVRRVAGVARRGRPR